MSLTTKNFSHGHPSTMSNNQETSREAATLQAQYQEVNDIYADLSSAKHTLQKEIKFLQNAKEDLLHEQNVLPDHIIPLTAKKNRSEELEVIKEAIPLHHAQTFIYEEWEEKFRKEWKALKKETLGRRGTFLEKSTRELSTINERWAKQIDEIANKVEGWGENENASAETA
jgi:ABC-type Fe3+-hydroxamate transport system substrate-binding protein